MSKVTFFRNSNIISTVIFYLSTSYVRYVTRKPIDWTSTCSLNEVYRLKIIFSHTYLYIMNMHDIYYIFTSIIRWISFTKPRTTMCKKRGFFGMWSGIFVTHIIWKLSFIFISINWLAKIISYLSRILDLRFQSGKKFRSNFFQYSFHIYF